MWVVKLGGSLLNTCDLQATLIQLADHGAGQLVIVPGGGVFVEQVRYLQKELCIDDVTAHLPPRIALVPDRILREADLGGVVWGAQDVEEVVPDLEMSALVLLEGPVEEHFLHGRYP